MIRIKTGKGEYTLVEENTTPGTRGNLILLIQEYRLSDVSWHESDKFKRMVFNYDFLCYMRAKYGELHCEYCGRPNLVIYHWTEKCQHDVATADHFFPSSKEPHLSFVKENLRVCCHPCNANKQDMLWPDSSLKYPYPESNRTTWKGNPQWHYSRGHSTPGTSDTKISGKKQSKSGV